MLVQLLVIAITWAASRLHLAFDNGDVLTAANLLASLILVVVGGALEHWAPAIWKAIQAKIGNNTTNLLLAAVLATGLGAGACTLSGCAQNETNRAAQGIVMVTAHADAVLALHDAHVLTREQELQLLVLIQAEQAAAKAYYASITAGDPTALAQAKAALSAATAAAAAELAKYQALHPTPTTAPSGTKFDR
jgi:hypothetical protein